MKHTRWCGPSTRRPLAFWRRRTPLRTTPPTRGQPTSLKQRISPRRLSRRPRRRRALRRSSWSGCASKEHSRRLRPALFATVS
ncbi:unnamed protein product [Symbiodinium sp. CCMP2456]|nr:unnamed protein product [Symbiodinium sp. CCMP2456]